MIKVSLTQFEPIIAASKNSAKSSVIATAAKVLPGVAIASALTADTLTLSDRKKSVCDICAFWECTL